MDLVTIPGDGGTNDVLFVVGLPGCGKTTLCRELERNGRAVFDDYKAHAHDDSSRFRMSRHYERLLELVRDGARCVVADIDFCRADARVEAEQTLREQIPLVRVEWLFFANDSAACEANIRRRHRVHVDRDLEKMREYSVMYSIPPGAAVIPVTSAAASSTTWPAKHARLELVKLIGNVDFDPRYDHKQDRRGG